MSATGARNLRGHPGPRAPETGTAWKKLGAPCTGRPTHTAERWYHNGVSFELGRIFNVKKNYFERLIIFDPIKNYRIAEFV